MSESLHYKEALAAAAMAHSEEVSLRQAAEARIEALEAALKSALPVLETLDRCERADVKPNYSSALANDLATALTFARSALSPSPKKEG